MRRRKADLGRRVNGSLRIEHDDRGLTSYAGLELFDRFLRLDGFNARVRRVFQDSGIRGDYGIVGMLRLFVGLILVGGRRLRHVEYLKGDPMIHRFSQLRILPDDATLSRWLKQFKVSTVDRLRQLNGELVASVIRKMPVRTLTLDIDGTVISTGLQVERAFRGYNPHHRKVPSYFPIMAYVAESGHVIRMENRSGNINDGKRSIGFLRNLFSQLEETLDPTYRLLFRMDGDYFKETVLRLLKSRGAGYAIKVPFWPWLNLQTLINGRKNWVRVDDEVDGFETSLFLEPWQMDLQIRIFRKRVFHQTRKNYQLDLFDPDNGTYEYSAVATNLPYEIRRLWRFMCGRGAHEKAIGDLKSGLALSSIPTNHYGANSAWQQLVVLTHTLASNFQVAAGAARRPRTEKRTALYRLKRAPTLRFEIINRAGRMIRPAGSAVLRLAENSTVAELYRKVVAGLERAA